MCYFNLSSCRAQCLVGQIQGSGILTGWNVTTGNFNQTSWFTLMKPESYCFKWSEGCSITTCLVGDNFKTCSFEEGSTWCILCVFITKGIMFKKELCGDFSLKCLCQGEAVWNAIFDHSQAFLSKMWWSVRPLLLLFPLLPIKAVFLQQILSWWRQPLRALEVKSHRTCMADGLCESTWAKRESSKEGNK